MRTAVKKKAPRGQGVSKPYPMNAPIKGWISNDNVAQIPPLGAFRLDNWFPETNSIKVRPGHDEFADLTGSSSAVNTVMVHNAGGVRKIFAAQGANIFNCTAGGDISSADLSSLTSDEWIWTNFTTTGGNYLYIVNGADSARHYDGTSWATPSITGVTSSTLCYVFPFANRLFFLEEDTATAHYLPVDAVAGAALSLEVGGELALGGTLVAGAALTHDAGDGPEDYCVFLSSEGEVIVYQGSDPSSVDTWAKTGRFRIARPIGKRCLLQIGGDLAVLTQDGVVSLSRSILLDRAAQRKGAFSDNIRKAFADQYALTGGVFGWDLISWPAGHMAIVNVPISSGTTYHQYAMNVLTGAWCRFTGINVISWALSGDQMFLGSADGRIMEFNGSGADDGAAVDAIAIGSYFDYKNSGVLKHVKGAQAFAKTDGQVTLGVNMAADFSTTESAVSSSSFGATTGSVWGTGLWGTAVWSEGEIVDSVWLGVAAAGYFIAPVIVAQVSGESTSLVTVEFIFMNIVYETGNILG